MYFLTLYIILSERKFTYFTHLLEPTDKEEIANIILGNINIINFKNLSLSFYCSTKGHTFWFWPCYVRYALLIFDRFPVEFSFLMSLLHPSLETTYRFIHLCISSQFCFIFLIMNIR